MCGSETSDGGGGCIVISYPSKARRETEAAASNSLSGITWQKRPLEKGVHKRERVALVWCDDDRSWKGKIPKQQQRFFFLQKVGCTEGRRKKNFVAKGRKGEEKKPRFLWARYAQKIL